MFRGALLLLLAAVVVLATEYDDVNAFGLEYLLCTPPRSSQIFDAPHAAPGHPRLTLAILAQGWTGSCDNMCCDSSCCTWPGVTFGSNCEIEKWRPTVPAGYTAGGAFPPTIFNLGPNLQELYVLSIIISFAVLISRIFQCHGRLGLFWAP